MKIKTAERSATDAQLLLGWGWRRRYAWLLFGIYTLLLVLLGAVLHRNGTLADAYRRLQEMPSSIERNRLGKTATPLQLSIQLEPQDYRRLTLQRERQADSLERAFGQTDELPATVRYDGKTFSAKIRMDADPVVSLDEKKWSLRLQVESGHSVAGMSRFVVNRTGISESIESWVGHQMLTREGIPTPRTEFLRVVLQGSDLGICSVEENADHAPPTSQIGRRAVAIQLDESSLQDRMSPRNDDGASSTIASQPGSHAVDTERRAVLSLLDRYRSGEIKTSDLFDAERLAAWFAVRDLTGNLSDWAWHETSFYFDADASRLVPIGSEIVSWKPTVRLNCMPETDRTGMFSAESLVDDCFLRFFRDPLFLKAYLTKLEEISTPEYLERLFEEIDPELQKILASIYSDLPDFEFSTAVLQRNQEYIRSVLHPVRGLVAYLEHPSPDRLSLQLGNPHYLPSEVLDAICGEWTLVPERKEFTLPGKSESSVIEYQPLSFSIPEGMEWKEELLPQLRVRYRVLGTGPVKTAAVSHWPYMPLADLQMDPTRKAPNLREFDFLVTDEPRKEISIRPGQWQIAKDLIIPPGYRVVAGEGVTLDLINESIVLSYSPWQLTGSEDSPIIIRSSDSTGFGVVVMNAKQRSSLEHVTFQNLGEPRRPGWALTGAVTFYESPVSFRACRFLDNRSEDGLNTVRSPFQITECHFAHTQGDAFDADFCEGSVKSSTFFNIGNDCIDVSGSTVEISGVRCEKAGDKGLSIGEQSSAVATDVVVQGGRIGLAVKDLSTFEGQDITVANCQYGVVTLRKKPEYGPASGEIQSLHLESVSVPYLIEAGTKLRVNGDPIQPNAENLRDELYDL